MMNEDKPKKIAASQVEVLGANGEVVKPSESSQTKQSATFGSFGQVHVMKGSHWMLLLIPVMIPFLIIGFFLLMILALFFGRGMFKIMKGQIRPRG